MRKLSVAALLAAALLLSSCDRNHSHRKDSGRPIVFVSILPQAFLAERIAGGHVDVDVLVGPGQNPHTYEPTPKQMTRLSQAQVFFTVGVPFEETLLPKLGSNRQLQVVDTRRGITLIPVAGHEGDDADGRSESATHGRHDAELDPHIWLSPGLAKVQAQTICHVLSEMCPGHKADFERNLAHLQADLDALGAEIATTLAPLKGRTFFVFHPAFGYFARDYGLIQQAVETGGKSPGPRHIKELIDKARTEGVRVIFVQPQFSEQAARTIAEQIGGVVIPVDPLSRNYIANLREVARKMRAALSPTTSPADGS